MDKDTQKQILEMEQTRWRNELELMRVRSRVADALGDSQLGAQIKKEVDVHSTECIKALEALGAMLKELE